jgi:hypothetical protein
MLRSGQLDLDALRHLAQLRDVREQLGLGCHERDAGNADLAVTPVA